MRISCFCGAVYDEATDCGQCPYCGNVASLPGPGGLPAAKLAEWRAERDEISRWLESNPENRAMKARRTELDALIREHTP